MKYEQAVIISFYYGREDDDPFYELAERLHRIMKETGVGVYDGHEIEINNHDGSYYLYGPSAENIMKAIKPALDATDFMKGAVVYLKFGQGKDAPSLEIEL